MGTTFFVVIQVLGAISFFIFGMKMMSDGIQKAAGKPIRNSLNLITNNRVAGVFVGLITTAAIQSSSAITILIVSLTNAGLISVIQSVGLIMGANIGTTVTAWIIAILDFHVNLYTLALPLLFIGVPMSFKVRGSLRHWGTFLIGFSLLLLSLYFLKVSIPDFDSNMQLFEYIQEMGKSGIASHIFFIFIGIFIAVIIQSSSAAIALILALCLKGYLPFELSLYLLLGTNIGTTLTAEIAALVGNTNAKRAARMHTMFNVIGVIYMMFLVPYLNDFVVYILEFFNQPDPNTDLAAIDYGLAIFHTLFNVLNTIVLLPLSGFLVMLVVKMIPKISKSKELNKSTYLNSSIRTPELSLYEIRKAIGRYTDILGRMLKTNAALFKEFNPDIQAEHFVKIQKYEKVSSNFNQEIEDYLAFIFEDELNTKTGMTLRNLFNINKELHQLSMVYTKLADTLDQKRNRKIWLSPDQRGFVNNFMDKIAEMSRNIHEQIQAKNFQLSQNENVKLIQSELIQINNSYHDELNELNMDNREDSDEELNNVRGTIVFENIINLLQTAANHYANINFYIKQV